MKATNHDGTRYTTMATETKTGKTNSILLRKCQIHGEFTFILSSKNVSVAVIVVAIMDNVSGRYGLWPSLSNPHTHTHTTLCYGHFQANMPQQSLTEPFTGQMLFPYTLPTQLSQAAKHCRQIPQATEGTHVKRKNPARFFVEGRRPMTTISFAPI